MSRDIIDPPPDEHSALGERGRPEHRAGSPRPATYGEPNGPTPPHFDILPKDEIEERAKGGGRDHPAPGKASAVERAPGGFASGMTTPETFETTDGEHTGIQRRDLSEDRLPEDGDP